MPSYFNISIQFRRKDLYPCFVQDFYSALFDAGMQFCSGYWESEKNSYEEIVAWNQKKLEQNFVLGYDQHVKHDYKQMLYDFAGFSEVRGYWMNEEPEKGVFSYEVIIPDDEVFEGYEEIISEGEIEERYVWLYEREKMEGLIKLAEGIWQFPCVRAIQTGLELDVETKLGALEKGAEPSVRPFAILDKIRYALDEKEYLAERVAGRDGVVIRDDLYFACYFSKNMVI